MLSREEQCLDSSLLSNQIGSSVASRSLCSGSPAHFDSNAGISVSVVCLGGTEAEGRNTCRQYQKENAKNIIIPI